MFYEVKKRILPAHVYGDAPDTRLAITRIMDHYTIVAFRPPVVGEQYIMTAALAHAPGVSTCKSDEFWKTSNDPRLIVVPKPPEQLWESVWLEGSEA